MPLARLPGWRALEVMYLLALALYTGLPALLVGVGCLTLAGWLWVARLTL